LKENQDIEQLFRKEFDSFEVQPSAKVWRGVRHDLFVRNFFRFSPWSVNVWYIGSVLLVGAIVVLNVFVPQREMQDANGIDQITEYKEQYANGKMPLAEVKTESNEAELYDKPVSRPKETKSSLKETDGKDLTALDNLQLQASASEEQIIPYDTRTAKHEALIGNPSLTAWFGSSVSEGCAPLSSNFLNLSQNAVRYLWSFGDGGSSELANPGYIFDKPGTWLVSLTAFSENNEISVYTSSIQVNPRPEASFSLDIQEIQGEGQTLNFYNYSSGADNYLWDFGDGTSSILKDPDHFFRQKTRAGIKLLAYTDAGCVDSFLMDNPLTDAVPTMLFPTAFSPSATGPGSGQYSHQSLANDVFHPNVSEIPEEYELKIYNRSGILLFESRDISVGWDGYYHEELVPRGVYVWKASARFADGKKVVKAGDVTVVW